jgi:hypothetical protein
MPQTLAPAPTRFSLSYHAELRTVERGTIDSAQLLKQLRQHAFVWLDRIGKDSCRFALVYCSQTERASVAVIAKDGCVLTVLTLEQFENTANRNLSVSETQLLLARCAALKVAGLDEKHGAAPTSAQKPLIAHRVRPVERYLQVLFRDASAPEAHWQQLGQFSSDDLVKHGLPKIPESEPLSYERRREVFPAFVKNKAITKWLQQALAVPATEWGPDNVDVSIAHGPLGTDLTSLTKFEVTALVKKLLLAAPEVKKIECVQKPLVRPEQSEDFVGPPRTSKRQALIEARRNAVPNINFKRFSAPQSLSDDFVGPRIELKPSFNEQHLKLAALGLLKLV